MRVARVFAAALASTVASAVAADGLLVDTEHPRILLGRGRLPFLRRERDREGPRWTQFAALAGGQASLPEPGFAAALYYRVAGDREAGRRAVDWALGPARDLRQLAMVFDWCQDLLDESQSRSLAAKLQTGIEQSARDASVESARDRLLAGIALAGHLPAVSASAVEGVVKGWWEDRIVPALASGRDVLPAGGQYALFELLHAARDNLNLDLRESAPAYFEPLPIRHLMSYYPAPWAGAENEYRIPASLGAGAPDLARAALARAAALSMVAFDQNSPGCQVLQGWLMRDRFQLRSPLGAPYEFLWANPYQPGLSPQHIPLVYHDARYGHFFARSSWDESASWLGVVDGQARLVEDRRVIVPGPPWARGAGLGAGFLWPGRF
jgi:hypothetical protein